MEKPDYRGWILTTPSGKVIHISAFDGWRVDQVIDNKPEIKEPKDEVPKETSNN